VHPLVGAALSAGLLCSATLVLTSDVRFEGFTTEDWVRFIRLWQPRAAPDRELTRPRGGVVVIHEHGQVLKLLHTSRGRLDPALGTPPSAAISSGDLGLENGQPSALEQVAREHHASWVLAMRLGALDEVMERFGARCRRGDDLTEQSLKFVGIVQEMMSEAAIATWPQRLRGMPVPTVQVTRRTLDALCGDGQTVALGLFDTEGLWTAFIARRRGPAFDLIAGPDELRPALGLLSGDWRRDYRHFARAVEERYGPLGFGCFAELGTFRALQTDARPGAWTRAVAVRDIVIDRMPVAVGLALGLDGARYALRGLIAVSGRIPPLAACSPMLAGARARIARLTGKDVAALLGFDPLEALRALLER
jgi:hypothetical protein